MLGPPTGFPSLSFPMSKMGMSVDVTRGLAGAAVPKAPADRKVPGNKHSPLFSSVQLGVGDVIAVRRPSSLDLGGPRPGPGGSAQWAEPSLPGDLLVFAAASRPACPLPPPLPECAPPARLPSVAVCSKTSEAGQLGVGSAHLAERERSHCPALGFSSPELFCGSGPPSHGLLGRAAHPQSTARPFRNVPRCRSEPPTGSRADRAWSPWDLGFLFFTSGERFLTA